MTTQNNTTEAILNQTEEALVNTTAQNNTTENISNKTEEVIENITI